MIRGQVTEELALNSLQNPIFPFKSTEENNNNKKMSFNLCSFQSLARMSHGELNEYWLCGPKLVTAVD